MEKLTAFLHVLAVVVWMGGVITLNALQVPLRTGRDAVAQGSLLRLSDRYGRAVIAPAAALTLLTGVMRVEQVGVGYGTLWVAWGILGILVSIAIGATLIRMANAELRLLVDAGTDDQRRLAVQRRLLLVNGVNLLVLLSAFWAMEFKPTL